MAAAIDIQVEQEGTVYIVKLSGRLDAASTPLVEKKLEKLQETSTKLLIDFGGVHYLSSAGMRLLLSTSKKLKAKKGSIAFYGMGPEVMEIIKIAGFDRILPIFAKKDEALKAL